MDYFHLNFINKSITKDSQTRSIMGQYETGNLCKGCHRRNRTTIKVWMTNQGLSTV